MNIGQRAITAIDLATLSGVVHKAGTVVECWREVPAAHKGPYEHSFDMYVVPGPKKDRNTIRTQERHLR